jgi:hypothetical protein
MRFLRSRAYDPVEDNPRHIDKFSPRHALTVSEWEHETQAEILILADVSASMAYPLKRRLRDAVILQLIYSLWRAGDRVQVALFAETVIDVIHEANLRAQMERYQRAVLDLPIIPATNIGNVLETYVADHIKGHISLIIVVSDFISQDISTIESMFPVRAVRQLHGDLVNIVVTFKLRAEIQGVGKVWDPERNRERMVMLSKGRRTRINLAEQERVNTVCRVMRDANIDAVGISEHRQIYPQLLNLARTRERRR